MSCLFGSPLSRSIFIYEWPRLSVTLTVRLQVVKAAVPHERVIRKGEEAHGAVLAAERKQGGCRVGGDAPDGAALR